LPNFSSLVAQGPVAVDRAVAVVPRNSVIANRRQPLVERREISAAAL